MAPQNSVTEVLERLAQGESLSAQETSAIVADILQGEWTDACIAAFLTALRVRGETAEELVGVATALRQQLPVVDHGIEGVLDTCGTGGDHAGTFNVSTAAAIVVAACGVPVAKHGNRGVSSASGSADVLTALGVNIAAEPAVVVQCLREVGIAFFFAPQWHHAMKRVMPVRQQLRFRTIFNLIGPLCNPARAEFQLVGVSRKDWAEKLAKALGRLGTRSAIVVAGMDGLDEVTLAAETVAIRIVDGQATKETWTPAGFGLRAGNLSDCRVRSPEESAATIRAVLRGTPGTPRNLVLANAAAALFAAGKAADLPEAVALASRAIDEGSAWERLERWIAASQSPAPTASEEGGDAPSHP